ncbi:hypothetical protein ABPG77_003943 [Micractinium sp. CCAP 211/92]
MGPLPPDESMSVAEGGTGAAAERLSAIPPGCLHLQRACVDQERIVLTDPAYRADAWQQLPLPHLHPGYHFNFPLGPGSNYDIWARQQEQLPPLLFRPLSDREPTPDLQRPVFDTSTVPLVLVAEWAENYGHTLGNSAAWLHAHLHVAHANWAPRAALVVQTPLGLALPSHWQPLVGPLVPHRPVQTLADFSARRLDTPRGSGSRCFADMLVCSGDHELQSTNVWQASQALVALNSPLPKSPVESALAGCDGTCLRVLFLTRSPKPFMRQVLNLEELVAQCNAWRHTDASSGQTFTADCSIFQPGADLKTNMAAVRSADAIVGLHGAGMANAFFAKAGAAMMEVFMAGWTWQVHRIWLQQDPGAQLQWWALTVNDTAAYSPGELEETLLPHPSLYKGGQGTEKRERDRNVHVPWPGVARLLQEYAGVQAAGGMPAYQARREAQQEPVHYVAQAGGGLEPGGTSTMFGGTFTP